MHSRKNGQNETIKGEEITSEILFFHEIFKGRRRLEEQEE